MTRTMTFRATADRSRLDAGEFWAEFNRRHYDLARCFDVDHPVELEEEERALIETTPGFIPGVIRFEVSRRLHLP